MFLRWGLWPLWLVRRAPRARLCAGELPRWFGFAYAFELSTILALVPLNLALGLWHRLSWRLRVGLRPREFHNSYQRGYLRACQDIGRIFPEPEEEGLHRIERWYA